MARAFRSTTRIKTAGEPLAKIVADCLREVLHVVDEALRSLESEVEACPEFVELRLFAGLSLVDATKAMGISRRFADRLWAFARAWLNDLLSKGDS